MPPQTRALPDRLAGVEQLERGEAALKPQSSSFLASALRSFSVGKPHDDHDQALAALHRRADEVVADLLHLPGLQAVDAEAFDDEQRIAVVEFVLAVVESFCEKIG